MSGKNETRHAIARLERDERLHQKEKQNIRNRRIRTLKRRTGKFSVLTFVIILFIGAIASFNFEVTIEERTTEINGYGNFDKILINYDSFGTSNIKYYFDTIDTVNTTIIASFISQSFYNKSINFYITVYIDGFAQPSENFVIKTESKEAILCKNNVSITFDFNATYNILKPIWAINYSATLLFTPIIIVIFGLCGFCGWEVVDNRWGSWWD